MAMSCKPRERSRSLFAVVGAGGAWPFYHNIFSAVARGRGAGQRTWHVSCVLRGRVLLLPPGAVRGRKCAFNGGAALAVFAAWRRVASLLQTLLGLAQLRFQGFELLGVGGDGLLPERVSRRAHAAAQRLRTFGAPSCPARRCRHRAGTGRRALT
jgi:hypothetical protein